MQCLTLLRSAATRSGSAMRCRSSSSVKYSSKGKLSTAARPALLMAARSKARAAPSSLSWSLRGERGTGEAR